MGKKKPYSGITTNYSGQQTKRFTRAVSKNQAARNMRQQHRKEHNLNPTAYVKIEEVKEIKKPE